MKREKAIDILISYEVWFSLIALMLIGWFLYGIDVLNRNTWSWWKYGVICLTGAILIVYFFLEHSRKGKKNENKGG